MVLPFLIRPLIGSLRPPVVPGSNNYGVGTFSPVIPQYDTLTVEIWAPGGGSGGRYSYAEAPSANMYFGGTGGQSYFAAPGGTIVANGGTGGGNSSGAVASGSSGSHGAASGGDVNTTGGGAAGGPAQQVATYSVYSGPGGYGAYVRKTYAYGQPGAPVPGTAYTLVVGAGGAPGGAGSFGGGAAGTNGSARLTWS